MSAVVVALLGVVIVTATPAAAQISGQVTGSTQVQTSPRDRVPPPRTGTSSLKGRVIDAATGAPVARARVRIMGGIGGPRPSAWTDSAGRFTFTSLPAGPYSLMVEKSTYMTGRYPDGGRTIRSNLRPLTLAEGEQLDNVTVTMYHGGSISGHVLDAHGDPVEAASVRVMRLASGRTPLQQNQSSTNDLGEFRLARLEPGNYVLFVAPRRDAMVGFDEPLVDGRPSDQTPAQPLPTYFPSALSLDQAQPITVARGESVSGIEVTLSEGNLGTIVGTVVTSEGQPVRNGFVTSRMMLKGMPEGSSEGGGTGLRPDGSFRLQLSPGEYSIEARANQPPVPGQVYQPDNGRSGMVRVSVAPSSTENVTIVVGSGATATGRVVFEGGTPAPPIPKPPIYLPIYNGSGSACRVGQPAVASDWTFRIDGLMGTCSGVQTTVFGKWTLKALTYGGENLLERTVTFEPGQTLKDVLLVFTDKRTELTFRVSDESGQLTRDYVAIVFPVEKARWAENVRNVRTYAPTPQDVLTLRMASLGSAANTVPPTALEQMRREIMLALPSGDYYVVAVDDIEGEASRDPRVLEQLMSSATRVTVSEESPTQVTLRRFKLSEIVR